MSATSSLDNLYDGNYVTFCRGTMVYGSNENASQNQQVPTHFNVNLIFRANLVWFTQGKNVVKRSAATLFSAPNEDDALKHSLSKFVSNQNKDSKRLLTIMNCSIPKFEDFDPITKAQLVDLINSDHEVTIPADERLLERIEKWTEMKAGKLTKAQWKQIKAGELTKAQWRQMKAEKALSKSSEPETSPLIAVKTEEAATAVLQETPDGNVSRFKRVLKAIKSFAIMAFNGILEFLSKFCCCNLRAWKITVAEPPAPSHQAPVLSTETPLMKNIMLV